MTGLMATLSHLNGPSVTDLASSYLEVHDRVHQVDDDHPSSEGLTHILELIQNEMTESARRNGEHEQRNNGWQQWIRQLASNNVSLAVPDSEEEENDRE